VLATRDTDLAGDSLATKDEGAVRDSFEKGVPFVHKFGFNGLKCVDAGHEMYMGLVYVMFRFFNDGFIKDVVEWKDLKA